MQRCLFSTLSEIQQLCFISRRPRFHLVNQLKSKHRWFLLLRNDLALLKLDKSPIMTDSVGVACLPAAGEILAHGTPCYLSGWGNLYSNVSVSLSLSTLTPAQHSWVVFGTKRIYSVCSDRQNERNATTLASKMRPVCPLSQFTVPCPTSCSRPCCLWWSTACAVAATGGAPS